MQSDRSPGRSAQLLLESPPQSQVLNRQRVLVVQYMGDYREAVERLDRGGEETYYAQRYSVNTMAEIGKWVEEIAVLACITDEPYNQLLSNGVRGIGGGLTPAFSTADLIQLVEPQRPTHLIITFPQKGLIEWALRQKIAVLPLLADSFNTRGWKAKIRNFLLAQLLNHKQITWVANHNVNSSKALQSIGVRADKIIPWDWVATVTPDRFGAKTLQQNDQPFTLFFAGSVTQAKGVGDVLNAVALLQSRGLNVHLKLAGNGEIAHFQEQIQQLKIADRVEFLGLIPNEHVILSMRAADAVVIPSRHEYPEGLPLTIYEALCSHTPIVASDHPMFRNKLVDRVSALIFPAQNATALADRVVQLFSDPTVYNTLSANSTKAWENLQIPVKFADLLNRWVFDSPENQEWLYRHRLASGQYS